MIIFILITAILFINILIYMFNNSNSNDNNYYRDIPSSENPAIVGLMVKGNIDGNDIVATLLDLSKRGYINIDYRYINGEEKSILSLTDKNRFMELKDYENYLLDEIFKNNNNEVIFDDFVSSNNFKSVFRSVGEMIKKRVSIKSTHKISKERNIFKINFISSYILFSFSLVFPLMYMLLKEYVAADLLISYVVGYFFLYLYKLITSDKKYKLDQMILGISITVGVLVFGVFALIYLVSGFDFDTNIYLNIFNSLCALLVIVSFMLGEKKYSTIDYIFIVYSIISLCTFNYVGISLGILYFSKQLYLFSPKHVTVKDNGELSNWFNLKNFLDDFTAISERGSKEVELWDKYLIYGIAMGVNKKTIKEFSSGLNIKLINQNFIDRYYVEDVDY